MVGALIALVAVFPHAALAAGLHVIPFPGTPDASPSTGIEFSSLSPAQLRTIAVRGSRSGIHLGRLIALPAGAGTAFLPRRAFSPGERVSVTARLSSSAAGSASGSPGATALNFSFTVARSAGTQRTSVPRRENAARTPPTQSFHSAPGLHPPTMTFSTDQDHTSGDIFLTPFTAPQVGPLILDTRGNVLWFRPITGGEALDLQVQHYEGRPVLTWWQGGLNAGHGTIFGMGEDVIADSSYRTIATLHAGNGYQIDLHEFQITPQGTALFDAYVPVHMDLTSYGGPADGIVLDCVVQELDIKTGHVLWEWHSLGHVPLTRSYIPVPTNTNQWWDYFHLNSIQQLPNGNLLVSSRSTWTIYEISRSTGAVLWTLGGKASSFKMGPGTNFEWQHDARMHPGGLLSLFDDASYPQEESQASAKLLRLNTNTMTATLVSRYTHSPPILAGLAGNAQILPNHDIFVGWGGAPDFSEYTSSGRQIFNGSFAQGTGTYRAYRFPWTGDPVTNPAVTASAGSNGSVTVYASWNGATQVSSWRVLGGLSPGSLGVQVPAARWTGFETTIADHGHKPKWVQVEALDAAGHVLGKSAKQAVH
jgi:Arylsulfotransferase (ASST)